MYENRDYANKAITAFYITNATFARSNRVVERLTLILMGVCIVIALSFKPALDAKTRFTQYAPTTLSGGIIQPIPGQVAHLDDDFILAWVEDCMVDALSLSPYAYRRQVSQFISKCKSANDATAWGNNLNSAGYLDLLQQGYMIDFRPTQVEMEAKRVFEGRHLWRVAMQGELVLYSNQTTRTNINVTVVVSRQDPYNFEHAISITQVVL